MRNDTGQKSLSDYGIEEVSPWTEWTQVNSTNVGAVRFNGAERLLEVVFHNGDKYRALDVEPSTWTNFLNSPSKGQFYYYAIRKFHTVEGPV